MNYSADQMSHFVDDDNFNTFRLPFGWQFLVNNQLSSLTLLQVELTSCLPN